MAARDAKDRARELLSQADARLRQPVRPEMLGGIERAAEALTKPLSLAAAGAIDAIARRARRRLA